MSRRAHFASATCLPLIFVACAAGEEPVFEPELSRAVAPLTHARGLAGDLVADTEVGRRDFTEDAISEVMPNGLSSPGGVAVDRSVSPGRAYIWDSANSRIAGFDLAQCYANPVGTRCTAQKVFGQPSLNDYGACNRDASAVQFPNRPAASASTLCGISELSYTALEDKSGAGMVVDASGNLWVTDFNNHRVLRYDSPFTTDTVADAVFGQANFSANGCNRATTWTTVPAPTASSLCFSNHMGTGDGAGLRLDAAGNLWVADGGNHRVLRFPKTGSTIASTADLVLGQSSFTTNTSGNALNKFMSPQSLLFDASGALYVADVGNTRVLIFKKNAAGQFVSGQSASGTLATFGAGEWPTALELDPQGRGIWTTHFYNNWDALLELWDTNGNRVSSVPAVDYWGNSLGSIAFDAQNNLLLTSYLTGQLVRYSPQADGSYGAVREFFTPPYDTNITSKRRFRTPAWTGVGVADHVIATKQLIVADGRLMFWNNPTALSLGQEPTGCVGSSDCLTVGEYSQLKVDASDRVWVAVSNQIKVFQAPLTTASTPIKTITSVPLLGGGGTVDLSQSAQGLAVSSDGQFLWVSQPSLNRVIRIRAPLTASPVVDVILGQTSLAGILPNQGGSPTLSTLAVPGALSLDRLGNLFVSDHFIEIAGNQRMLVFSAATFPASPSSVIYAPAAYKEFPSTNPALPYRMATFEPAFDASNRMVVGINPDSIADYGAWYTNNMIQRFPVIFDNPLAKNASNPSDPAYAVPNGRLEDFYSWPIAATFDSANNLYMMDANRGRVNVYYTPFGAPPSTLQAQYKNNDLGAPNDNQIKPNFNLVNLGSSSIPLTELTVRYYLSSENSTPAAQNYWIDYAAIGAANVRGRFVAATCTGTNGYFEVYFVGGTLAAASQTGEIATRISKPDFSAYNESNDYSYIAGQSAFANSSTITVYRNGSRVWGTPPSGCN